MSLGVLNNISALYAENNLNQTQGSLQNTLTQLSSGSRINSGADDAAGLSLADGLTASSAALTQSAMNAKEGVDFLSVADGALSQVTNLLNRAVTLATEASNGTLNSSQQAATQAEYSSIMTEISTINGNTEYNGLNVFSDAANVFTSDGTLTQTYAKTALGSASADSLSLGSAVYTSGTVAAATASQVGKTDSYGNAIASGDNVLAATDASGKSVNLDLTAMGDSSTATGALSAANAVAISGGKATKGTIGAAPSGGTDQYGTAIASGSYVFNAGSTVNTTSVVTKGAVAAATAGQVGTKDSYGNTITATTDNILTFTDSTGATQTLDLTAKGLAATSGTADATALSIVGSGSSATFTVGAVATATAGQVGTADEYGKTIGGTDYVFTAGATKIDMGTTDPGTVTNAATFTPSHLIELGSSAPTGTVFAGTSLDSTAQAAQALSAITSAISQVASMRGTEGAQVNTLTAVENVQTTQSTNTTSAENDVMATDYASASSNLSKFQILEQSGISALAQANSTEQLVTKLLQ